MIDAGPLIATLFKKDRYHQQAIIGFNKLKQEQQKLILPLPIVFEVHRWLLQKQGAMLAQTIFAAIDRSFEIYTIKESDFQSIKAIALHFPDWSGTLADASVVYQLRSSVQSGPLIIAISGVLSLSPFGHPNFRSHSWR